jgi:hypothetical protein
VLFGAGCSLLAGRYPPQPPLSPTPDERSVNSCRVADGSMSVGS